MPFEDKIKALIEESVARNPEMFVLSVDIDPRREVRVVVDGYRPVPLSECVRVMREVQEGMDPEQEDFALTVSTFDISQWFSDPRQFPKNLGKKLKVVAGDREWEGVLTRVEPDKIVLEEKVREPKPVGKGKHTVTKQYEIPFEQIHKAKVKLQF